jgi:hypothetical protein
MLFHSIFICKDKESSSILQIKGGKSEKKTEKRYSVTGVTAKSQENLMDNRFFIVILYQH